MLFNYGSGQQLIEDNRKNAGNCWQLMIIAKPGQIPEVVMTDLRAKHHIVVA